MPILLKISTKPRLSSPGADKVINPLPAEKGLVLLNVALVVPDAMVIAVVPTCALPPAVSALASLT